MKIITLTTPNTTALLNVDDISLVIGAGQNSEGYKTVVQTRMGTTVGVTETVAEIEKLLNPRMN